MGGLLKYGYKRPGADADFWSDSIVGINLLQLSTSPLKLTNDQINFLNDHQIDSNKAQTILDAIIYARCSVDVHMITFGIGGSAALLVEDINVTVLSRLCHDVLSHYLKTENKEQNRPIFAFKSEWRKNRFIRGSCSFHSTNSTRNDQDTLREPYKPDGIPRILFAGEATHQRFFSTIHSAFERLHSIQRINSIPLKRIPMNYISLIIFLGVMITMIHCSIISRTNNRNDVDPFGLIRDNYGCDAVIKSCGNKGKCCDVHDACYKRHGCKAISWIYLWGNCRQCNLDVMACAVRQNPGKSSCCSAKNCGQPRP
ncbi:unnamed protein product [Adineta ricciae]|uniref:Amine oxidase domain-containing protein n=2 Tax=Adineta ricciae TaxID=249248 RepID=A0A815RTY4_ADIRI|nr:unnamed protein product [Adineta ricciae]